MVYLPLSCANFRKEHKANIMLVLVIAKFLASDILPTVADVLEHVREQQTSFLSFLDKFAAGIFLFSAGRQSSVYVLFARHPFRRLFQLPACAQLLHKLLGILLLGETLSTQLHLSLRHVILWPSNEQMDACGCRLRVRQLLLTRPTTWRLLFYQLYQIKEQVWKCTLHRYSGRQQQESNDAQRLNGSQPPLHLESPSKKGRVESGSRGSGTPLSCGRLSNGHVGLGVPDRRIAITIAKSGEGGNERKGSSTALNTPQMNRPHRASSYAGMDTTENGSIERQLHTLRETRIRQQGGGGE